MAQTDPQTQSLESTETPGSTAELAETALVEEVSIDEMAELASALLVEEVSIDGMCGVY